MKPSPSPPIPSTVPALAERLEALADGWLDLATATAGRPISSGELDAVRNGLNALAEEAEAEDCESWARAVQRIALLSEVWECLRSEPGQDVGATEVAEFCLGAMRHLARDERAGNPSGDAGLGEGILRESDRRWSDYLSPVDPTCTGSPMADEPVSFEEDGLAQDDPPALGLETLLGLLMGSGEGGSRVEDAEPGSVQPTDEARPWSGGCTHTPGPLEAFPTPPEPTALELEIPSLPMRIELDDEMREAFLADASDLFERVERIVVGLGSQDDPRGAIHELGRCLHTLKGAAGSVGLKQLATLVHELEERLGQVGKTVSPGLLDLLHQVVGYLDGLIGLLRRGPDPPERTVPAPGEAPVPSQGPGVEGPIRVPATRFDELTDVASELIMQGRFWLSQAGSMKTFAATAQVCRNRLLGSLDRMHDFGLGREGRNRPATIDPRADLPAQLRRLAEQASDLAVLAESAQAAAAAMVDRGDTLVRLSLQLWDSFQSLRIVPIRGLFQRLARVLHEAARVEGRQVELVMVGEETGVDRAIQDKAFEPLLHVVRNAVSHGIESPADRVKLGKPPTGRVTLEARREGNNLLIAVEDDGKGLDDEAIAAKARRLGWLAPDEKPGRDRLQALIFEPGFSTKSLANAIAGRGVGMDVVAREVSQLRGTVDLDSHPGRGTRLTVRLPARLALEPALIVRVGGQPFAVLASQVEQAQPFETPVPSRDASQEPARTDPDPRALELPVAGCSSQTGLAGSCGEPAGNWELGTDNARLTVTYRDQAIPVLLGREILGIGPPSSASWPKLVVVRTGSRLIGLVVDEIDGADDLVIKPLGELLAGHPLVSGTSLSINGEVILVLNASGLERRLKIRAASGMGPSASCPVREGDDASPGERMAVLVVDDSISVRRGVARQLHDLGLEVHEVSDGLEALGRLRRSRYGLVVTDLEMPKLDGFALLAEMKRSPTLSTTPVIVASTRGDSETRLRVLELGAQALLSKPVDPLELVRIIEPLLTDGRG